MRTMHLDEGEEAGPPSHLAAPHTSYFTVGRGGATQQGASPSLTLTPTLTPSLTLTLTLLTTRSLTPAQLSTPSIAATHSWLASTHTSCAPGGSDRAIRTAPYLAGQSTGGALLDGAEDLDVETNITYHGCMHTEHLYGH